MYMHYCPGEALCSETLIHWCSVMEDGLFPLGKIFPRLG